MPIPGSETYSSATPVEVSPKSTSISESAEPPEVIHGEDWPEDLAPPMIDSLDPESMEVPGPDAVVIVSGHGFTPETVIVWNESDEPTTFIDETKVSTLVRPSTVQADLPFELPVAVRNGEEFSNTLLFTFVHAEVSRKKRR